jgi:hypothetical protein
MTWLLSGRFLLGNDNELILPLQRTMRIQMMVMGDSDLIVMVVSERK